MKFGFSYAKAPHTETLELWETARDAGFDQAWASDSHIIWQEAWSLMGWLIGSVKPDFEFGTCVTNPSTRDPIVTASAFATLNQITDGRMICGIGRGDSAVRVINSKPARLADVEHAVEIVRTIGSGKKMEVNGVEAQLPWASGRVPVYVAGYGPKALRLAGKVGDGVIFQIADPFVIEWSLQHVRAGAEEAGRNPDDLVLHCATATYVSDDLDEAREQCRWFGAVVGNHIADILRHHAAESLPDELISYVEGRGEYDYREHAEVGSDHSRYVPDEIVDRFCVVGNRNNAPRSCARFSGWASASSTSIPRSTTSSR
jgi:probable F420-dependent oxidoreductase